MGEKKKTQEYTKEMLEQIRQEAFMEGYRYAIEILKAHIVDKKRQSRQNELV